MSLDDVPGSQPDGFILRFPFYVLGERDANVVFADTQYPDWFLDDVYEFSKHLAIKPFSRGGGGGGVYRDRPLLLRFSPGLLYRTFSNPIIAQITI